MRLEVENEKELLLDDKKRRRKMCYFKNKVKYKRHDREGVDKISKRNFRVRGVMRVLAEKRSKRRVF